MIVIHLNHYNDLAEVGIYSAVGLDSAISVPTGTWTKILSLSVPSAGTYIAIARCRFADNDTGSRAINISTTSASTVIQQNSLANSSGVVTQLQCNYPFKTSSSTTIYLNAWQSSGAKLNVSAGAGTEIRLIKISSKY